MTALEDLPSACLTEVVAAADLQHRVDRKYLVDTRALTELVGALEPTHHVLRIDGREATTYRTVYFDTPELASWRAHIQRRRRRWKVRIRSYVEDGLHRLEIKTKDGRGATVKHAQPLSEVALDAEFADQVLADIGAKARSRDLTPTAEVTCVRSTLADLTSGTRVTLDRALSITRHGRVARLADAYHLVETKGGPHLGLADRILLGLGLRPISLSKYVIGLSLLDPLLPGNDLRRIARRHFHLTSEDFS